MDLGHMISSELRILFITKFITTYNLQPSTNHTMSVVFQELMRAVLGVDVLLLGVSPVHGGDINEAYRVETEVGVYFVKANASERYPNMFAIEAAGLELLSSVVPGSVPAVAGVQTIGAQQFLVLPFIHSSTPKKDHWVRFAHILANMHGERSSAYGLEYANYIGSLRQENTPMEVWADFYVQCRLHPLLVHAFDTGAIAQDTLRRIERIFPVLERELTEGYPALLHGDLWSGNVMCDGAGEPMLIDPAVYYGHREMDLAMMRLFGGFPEAVFSAYDAILPPDAGCADRVPLYQLYPLMVHVCLFGGSYTDRVLGIVRRYT